jgi:hypothetical protein
VLTAVAAGMVPAADGLPSGGAESTLGAWLGRIEARDPFLFGQLAEAAGRAAELGEDGFRRAVDAGEFPLFEAAVLEAWFGDPAVRERYGYQGSVPVAAIADEPRMRELAAAVAARPAPAGTGFEAALESDVSRSGGAQ